MSDVLLGGGWLALLALGLTTAVLLHRAGVPTTYVRDLVHVGASSWVFGWARWSGPWVPMLIVTAAAVFVMAVPFVRHPLAHRVRNSISGGGERWAGIVVYVLAYGALTVFALTAEPTWPPAAAALALSWGDGIGGLVGRKLGRHRYTLAWSKTKSLEGSAAVWLMAAVGAVVAQLVFGPEIAIARLLAVAAALGAVAALAEALAPRGADNAWVPAAVFIAAMGVASW